MTPRDRHAHKKTPFRVDLRSRAILLASLADGRPLPGPVPVRVLARMLEVPRHTVAYSVAKGRQLMAELDGPDGEVRGNHG